jgi:hypothetical protein
MLVSRMGGLEIGRCAKDSSMLEDMKMKGAITAPPRWDMNLNECVTSCTSIYHQQNR